MPKWLVTGATGFIGRHLLKELDSWRTPDVEIVASGRGYKPHLTSHPFIPTDLEDPENISRVICQVEPSVVIHLAGLHMAGTWRIEDAQDLYRSNTLATVHLLDALRSWGGQARVVLAGSAAEYGPVDEVNLPVCEDHPCHPSDAYGLSKWLATAAGLATRPPLEVVVARIFNAVGEIPNGVLGVFALNVAARPRAQFEVGDIDTRRDFIDVRDAARALIALAIRGRPGQVYNVGTGTSHRVGDGLEYFIKLAGRDIAFRVNPKLARRAGPRDSRADIRKIIAHTGWRPQTPWEQILHDLWDQAGQRARSLLTT